MSLESIPALSDSISTLHGVGPKTTLAFAEIGIHTIADLLLYLPTQHEDRTHTTPINQITEAGVYTMRVRVERARARKTRNRKTVVEALMSDDSGSLHCTWFHQPYVQTLLQPGREILLSGKVTVYGAKFTCTNPFIDSLDTPRIAGKVLPIYPLHGTLTQTLIRKSITQALKSVSLLPEDVSPKILAQHNLPSLQQSLIDIHTPRSMEAAHAAKRRVALAQLLAWQANLHRERKQKKNHAATPYASCIPIIKRTLSTLPFELNSGQKKALWDIIQDIGRATPMMRLVCGDVGSGKTVVAALASIPIIEHGDQVVLLAPTTILAEQHYETIRHILQERSYRIALHTQHTRATSTELAQAQYIIGTHALLQDTVHLPRVGLVIVDEQHRFGVAQRDRILQDARSTPHFLSLTATPIPRTFALNLFGYLNMSVLDAALPGRLPVQTHVIDDSHRERLYAFMLKRIRADEGCFVICPLIHPSDTLSVTSTEQEYERLTPHLPNARIAMLHGKLSSEEKNRIMNDFRSQRIDVLISTTVIEVGIDIPHATVILIEDADRFGLATLHQLRGRVGRSDKQSYCFVTTTRPKKTAAPRLKMFARTHSGAKLAEYDIHNRGAGDLLGTLQSGLSEIVATAMRYPELLSLTQDIQKKFTAREITALTQSPFFRRLKSVHLE